MSDWTGSGDGLGTIVGTKGAVGAGVFVIAGAEVFVAAGIEVLVALGSGVVVGKIPVGVGCKVAVEGTPVTAGGVLTRAVEVSPV